MTKYIMVFVVLSQALAQDNEYKKNYTESNTCGQFTSPCKRSPYRSYDGSCNNLKYPRWGSAGSAYVRLFSKNSYSDGIHEWPRSSSNKSLMNPRSISMKVSPDVYINDRKRNVITVHWGQALAHDMSLTGGVIGDSVPTCCTNGEPIPPKVDQRCMPIPIPDDDFFNAPEGNTCFNFVRTVSNKDIKCDLPGKTEEPISVVTGFIDLSMVYGSSEKQAKEVRAGKNGKMKYTVRKGQHWLPQNPNATSACSINNTQEACYLAGDERVNQNPHLAVVQTMLMREHNRIANSLFIMNPHWDDEKCFQETRRILIAIAQHITYHEFIYIHIGQQNVIERGLDPNTDGYVNDYNPEVNPHILNEHATTAFRGPHSEVVGFLKSFNEDRQLSGQIRLSDWFNRPSIIEEDIAGLARGLCFQPQKKADRFYDPEISQFLFRRKDEILGVDLHALDIQRSRDHGMPPYIVARKACGLPVPQTFSDLNKYMLPKYVQLLQDIYSDLRDVELTVAGILETLVPGALAGPTFVCIMTEQFYRSRVGDRHFYTSGFNDGAFTPCQLKSIRKATMSRLVCNNIPGVKMIQPDAFSKISEQNSLVPCHQLPQVDLKYWKEDSEKNCKNS